MTRLSTGLLSLYLALSLSALTPVYAASQAGEVESLDGSAQAISPAGQERSLSKGDKIYTGDRVLTKYRASLRLRFLDKTKFELGPNSDMTIDKFVYDPDPAKSSFATRIAKGAFRFVTGLVARFRPAAMRVGLPVATIGIRGTNVVGQADATTATVILLEPEGESKPTAVEVSNDYGSVIIDKPGYGTEVPDEHSPPSPVRRMQLRTIQNLMGTFRSIQQMSIPRPMPMPHFH